MLAIGLQQVGERAGQLLGLCHGLPVEAQELPGRGDEAHALIVQEADHGCFLQVKALKAMTTV